MSENIVKTDERVELHLHTTFSKMDALTKISEIVKTAGEYGHPAVAITDYCSVQGFPEAYRASEKYGVKVIYGIECDCFNDNNTNELFRIVIIVKNATGKKNLYKLLSYCEDGKLNVSKSMLRAHREGLLFGTVGNKGELYKAILNQRTKNTITQDKIFAIADFYDYIEVHPCFERITINGSDLDRKEQEEINIQMSLYSDATGKPLVAVGNVHFPNPEDEICKKVLLSSKGISTDNIELPLYFKTTKEMLADFSYLGEATAYKAVVLNTQDIANSVDDKIYPFSRCAYYPTIKGSKAEIDGRCMARAEAIYGKVLPGIVKARLDWELKSINKHDFYVIFSIAQKLVERAKSQGYTVGSRGCVAASFVSYLLGITDINPLAPHYRCNSCKYTEFDIEDADNGFDLPDKICPVCGSSMDKDGFNLAVETVFGRDGDMVPDIDLNFAGEYHSEAVKHLEEMFGESHVLSAGTISTLSERIAFGYAERFNDDNGNNLSVDELVSISERLAGVKRSDGLHPGGFFIVPTTTDITDFSPAHNAWGKRTTHFTSFELSGYLLKIDVLGHESPSLLKELQSATGVSPNTIPLDDKETLHALISGDTIGVPEYQNKFIRKVIQEAQPKTFADLIKISGLSHGTNTWTDNADTLISNGTATIKDVISLRDDIMQYLMRKGMDRTNAHRYMELVRKGKICAGYRKEGWESELREFGIDEWYIESMKKIRYLFPKAHATVYVIQSFQLAWYKVHHPIHFYSVLLNRMDKDNLFTASDFEKSPYDLQKELEALKAQASDDYYWGDNYHDKRIRAIELLNDFLVHGYSYVPYNEQETKESKQRIKPGTSNSIHISNELFGEW